MITKNQSLYFVWELHTQIIDIKKGTARFANKNLFWYIGKEEDLKIEFPDTEDTTFGFCNPSIPIIVMKSRQTDSNILQNKAFIGNAFAEAKRLNADISDYEEWLIYEKNMQTPRIQCETCKKINECNVAMDFPFYCDGTMKWKNNELSCLATFDFKSHSYKLRETDIETLKAQCFEEDGSQCWINACCKLSHKDHAFINVEDDGRRKLSWFKTEQQCTNCGTRKVGLKDKYSLEKLKDKLFELFVDQYMTYWRQRNRSSEMMAKGYTERQRDIHTEIKVIIEGDMMVVQKAVTKAEEKYGDFSSIVMDLNNESEALAKAYDYADVSTNYIMQYELGLE
ncbi:hypothetical protein LCGC14_0196390 [marine sediment metagenome]|uniref:Uncharacterized protein n=1 Tax=marine sediment metagenome TaxID=412755 RepID=A0A0F9X4Q8_9ZZZZ